MFTGGNAPLRCGRAIWFRRNDMKAVAGKNKVSSEFLTSHAGRCCLRA
ncbi:type IV secretory system conjugative DNA transfer family protein [Oryzicola mucosus]